MSLETIYNPGSGQCFLLLFNKIIETVVIFYARIFINLDLIIKISSCLYLLIACKFMSAVLDMPKRPPWKYSMTKQQVERTEEEMFENFLEKIYDEYKLSELSYFERNLEVILTNNTIFLLVAIKTCPSIFVRTGRIL